jgi:hypothetical protein
MRLKPLRSILSLTLGLLLLCSRPAGGFSLLTHEQLIDLTWQDSIVPLLLSRYPNLTPEELENARAYAYGGCVIQDMGYYPFGDKSFSNLTHYVRSGDFVVNLFRNASSANELAFAVGALSHYMGDSIGHPYATNIAVPVEFPKLAAKYGPEVSYAQGKHQHVQTEFAFDINEIAHHRVAPLNYLRHVGLKVPVRQLALAYYQTYGLTEDFSVTKKRRFNVREYRFAVRTLIPRIAYAINVLHRRHEPVELDTPEKKEIEKEVATVAAQNDWAAYRHHAGIGTYALAGLILILPKIGPLKLVAVKGPTQDTEAEYMHAVVLSVSSLRRALRRFTPHDGTPAPPKVIVRLSRSRLHPVPNRDLDTGQVVKPGGYPLTDSTYADLLHRLTLQPDQPIPPGIKSDIQAYYSNPDAPITTKNSPEQWKQVQSNLATLATMPTSTAPEPYPTYGDDAEGIEAGSDQSPDQSPDQ